LLCLTYLNVLFRFFFFVLFFVFYCFFIVAAFDGE